MRPKLSYYLKDDYIPGPNPFRVRTRAKVLLGQPFPNDYYRVYAMGWEGPRFVVHVGR